MRSGWLTIGALAAATGWATITILALLERWTFQRRQNVLARLRALLSDGPIDLQPGDALREARRLLHAQSQPTVARLLTDSLLPHSIEALCCERLLEGSGENTLARVSCRGRWARQRRRRIEALRVLAMGRSPRALDLLSGALETGDAELAWAVAGILGRVPDRRAALLLIDLMGKHGESAGRAALFLDGFPEDIDDLLVPLTVAGDPKLRSWAAVLLRRYARRPDLPRLLAALAVDPDPGVRTSALATLADVGGTEALQMAQQCLADPVAAVRVRAARALGAMKATGTAWRIALLLGDRERTVRTAARDALVALGPEAALVLGRLLSSDDQFVREGAAEVLATLAAGSPGPLTGIVTEWRREELSPDARLAESERPT